MFPSGNRDDSLRGGSLVNIYKYVQLGHGDNIHFAVTNNGVMMKGLRSESYGEIQKKLEQHLRITFHLHHGVYKVVPIC